MDKNTLKKVQDANFPDTPEGKILADSQKKIGDITDHFTNPDNISATKIDLTNKVEAAGFTVEQYESVFGSIKRSEADAVQYVADQVADIPGTPDKSNKLRLAQARARAARAKLALLDI